VTARRMASYGVFLCKYLALAFYPETGSVFTQLPLHVLVLQKKPAQHDP
jgi:hypothetical protein